MDAIKTLEKQRESLQNKIKGQIREIISLYDLGVSLDILPTTPSLRHSLETAHAHFSDKEAVGVKYVMDRHIQ